MFIIWTVIIWLKYCDGFCKHLDKNYLLQAIQLFNKYDINWLTYFGDLNFLSHYPKAKENLITTVFKSKVVVDCFSTIKCVSITVKNLLLYKRKTLRRIYFFLFAILIFPSHELVFDRTCISYYNIFYNVAYAKNAIL